MQIDRALATKLAAILKLVMHGKTLPVAIVEAGVSKAEMERVVKELERELWTRARARDEDDARVRPATTARMVANATAAITARKIAPPVLPPK